MSKYFTLNELTRSATALARGIDNTPPHEAAERLGVLAERLLDPVRELWGAPLRVNSGYRSPALNTAVGGAAGSREGNEELFEMIVASGLDFDQLIDENGYSWLHVSYREGRNRRQILHL